MANTFLQWFYDIIKTFSNAYNWLTNPIMIGDISFSPLLLITFTGLSAFIGIAVIKWVIS